jgi:hypothetical protein
MQRSYSPRGSSVSRENPTGFPFVLCVQTWFAMSYEYSYDITVAIWGFPQMGIPNSWMVYKGKSIYKWIIWGCPYFRKLPYIAI